MSYIESKNKKIRIMQTDEKDLLFVILSSEQSFFVLLTQCIDSSLKLLFSLLQFSYFSVFFASEALYSLLHSLLERQLHLLPLFSQLSNVVYVSFIEMGNSLLIFCFFLARLLYERILGISELLISCFQIFRQSTYLA